MSTSGEDICEEDTGVSNEQTVVNVEADDDNGDDQDDNEILNEKVMNGDVVPVNDSLLQTSQELEMRKIKEEKEIPKEERMFGKQMNLYEYSRLIGARMKQLDDQGIKMTDPETQQPIKGIWSKEIAENEMNAKVFPILLKRYYPRGSRIVYFEMWDPREMILPVFHRDNAINFYE
jgi:DNA-directed RNA polymerase subunit K/omega